MQTPAEPKTKPMLQAPVTKPFSAATPRPQRSRKPVGELIVRWMEDNPGWHSERALLKAVTDNGMTDANPKRAMKIALGRRKNRIFEQDGRGRWRLVAEGITASPPTRPAKRSAKKDGDSGSGDERSTRVIRRKRS